MNKTNIEWCDFTFNPVKGLCPVACPYCYARRMYKRFKWDEAIRFEAPALIPPKGSKIFVGSTMELFGEWIRPDWLKSIFSMVEHHPENTFLFLTKRPENLIKWSPFPDNCWVGVSCTDRMQYLTATGANGLDGIIAKVKFISFEPLLDRIAPGEYRLNSVNWVIIGAETKNGRLVKAHAPKIEWVKEIVDAADNAGVPVFEKNNLKPLLGDNLRQEFPVNS